MTLPTEYSASGKAVTMPQCFVQMSGIPGSGKTAIARRLGTAISAFVLDHDDTKSALLSCGIDEVSAGRGSYETLKVLSQSLVKQGKSVIIDSPCLYKQLLNHGLDLAEAEGIKYGYIECCLDDEDVLQRRLTTRPKMPSQVGSLDDTIVRDGKNVLVRDLFRSWARDMQRPPRNYLAIDTKQPIDVCVEQAVSSIQKV